ncbi:hypothetical protein INS49_002981 [Diaporthe citri]|uniref:uncharacterized protein n=1 Tax=Diaporthe citri TaxID=83186 RepID=UPI001C816623|nr:uncharacterized protein INS49_002981 [Diaporthe citri]KAG6368767.1 hypothetical protein INS49_002981 [Diaporthe citri]
MSVRNLRAMFENKTQDSPPERGRSPAGTESPRPLSKVRTSFVAIEKDGRIGLQQRNPSEASASSISGRKLSGDTETTEAASSVQMDNTGPNVSSATTSQPEPVREVAALAGSGPPKGLAESPQIKEDPRARKSDYGIQARKSQGVGDQEPAAPEPAPAPVPAVVDANKTNSAKAVGTPAKSTPAASAAPASDDTNKTNGAKAVGTPAKPTPATSAGPAVPAGDDVNKTNSAKAVGTPAKSTPAASAAPASDDTNKTNGAKAVQTPVKSIPAASAGPAKAEAAGAPRAAEAAGPGRLGRSAGAPAPAPAAVPAAAAPSSKVTSKEALKSPDPAPQPKPASKPTNTASHPPTTPKAVKPNTEKKAAPVSASPGGFVKPRPKSPTRPVKLPPSLTTHTTASGSRTRTSGSAPPSSHENSARSVSRSKALGRSSSAASRQRPSIGPPPKLPAKDHPVVKKDAKVDEGFLARMMRPTQSSASKVNEKVPVTPPRRPAAAPKKSASAKSATTKRPVSKTTSATTSAAPSPERTKKESSADRDIATVIEKMSIAENVQETPKTPEREATIAEELEEEKTAEPLANGAHKETEAVSQPADKGAEPEQEEW